MEADFDGSRGATKQPPAVPQTDRGDDRRRCWGRGARLTGVGSAWGLLLQRRL